jgi:hypothetical protein
MNRPESEFSGPGSPMDQEETSGAFNADAEVWEDTEPESESDSDSEDGECMSY